MLGLRIKTILILVMAISWFLMNSERTDADLFADRVVTNNRFTATTLSFGDKNTATNTSLSQLFVINGFIPGGYDIRPIRIKKEGKLDFKYRISTAVTSSQAVLCASLHVQVLQNWQVKYAGKLADLSIDSTIPKSGVEDWVFVLQFDDQTASLKQKQCDFNFIIKTYRDDPASEKGFYAKRVLSNTIIAGTW
ncbi:hypothetical protein HGA88_01980 [Candidatus Roizmanbacteria bacterium]|nr:hypothetical protein [Candidatus Roizmanbacteria bacterium]